MFNTIIKLSRVIGLDKSIAYSSGSKIASALMGVMTVFFVAMFLSGDEQGYYFTFGSLLALQVFFELGLTSIITQYVAHEASHLEPSKNNTYNGDDYYLSRLSSLVHFCIKWYSYLGVLVFLFLIIVGFVFFSYFSNSASTTDISWRKPWVLICLSTTIKFIQSPLTSIYMGLDYMKEMMKITFYQSIIQPMVIWFSLFCGLKLYSIGIGYFASCMVWCVFVYRHSLIDVLTNFWCMTIKDRVDYKKEILPFQWRIALSWVSGYFIYQLFNPVLFATEGAVVAGQMGMSISILSAIQSFSNSWVSTKVPVFSKLIALKKYTELDVLYDRTNLQMSSICFTLLMLLCLFLLCLKHFDLSIGGTILSDRFLPFIPMLFMSGAIFSNIWLTTWGIYLRCHKKEPLLVFSVVSGLLCCVSTLCLGYNFGLYGITIGYFIIMALSIPWVYYIYKTKKIEWHEK